MFYKLRLYIASKLYALADRVDSFEEEESDLIREALSSAGVSETVGEEDLVAVKEFFEHFIGIIIVGFISYSEYIDSIDKNIHSKILTSVSLGEGCINLHLSELSSGKASGYMKITPSLYSSFLEKGIKDSVSSSARYKIAFYGGDCVEYSEENDFGHISFYGDV